MSIAHTSDDPQEHQRRLRELAGLFLRLGATAFGGPAAHIAMMEDEVVTRRGWLSRQQLLDLLGATNLIPGPNSTELAIYIGYQRAGLAGLLVAGTCFIVPAMLIVWGLAALYVWGQTLPHLAWMLYGIKPVLIAIVGQALWRLGQSAVRNRTTAVLGTLVIALAFLGGHELLLLGGAGIVAMLSTWRPRQQSTHLLAPVLALSAVPLASAPIMPLTLHNLFYFFLKIGSLLYGSGYVLLAFLQNDLVERWHWLTATQLLDAIAIGQVTPGPVFTTATFIGYLLSGTPGALVATAGIFLPAFLFVALVHPWVARLRQSSWAHGFLDGLNVASMGLMAVVTWKLALTALSDLPTIGTAVLSGVLVFYGKLNTTWLILAGGLLGIATHLM